MFGWYNQNTFLNTMAYPKVENFGVLKTPHMTSIFSSDFLYACISFSIEPNIS